jgi:hypothetical protein
MPESFEGDSHDFSLSDDLPTVDELVEMEVGGHDYFSPPDLHGFEAFSPSDETSHLVVAAHHSVISLGTPDGQGFTHQTTAFDCDVVAQKMILDDFGVVDPRTGQPVSEAQLVYDATVHGWLTDHGTSIDDMGRLLEFYGVDCHHGHGLGSMMQELSAGKRVIVAVDADELWSQDWHSIALWDVIQKSPNHAILIKGIKQTAQGHLVAVVNDPGQPNGAGVEYPLEQFEEAFNDSDFHYVATDSAPADRTESSIDLAKLVELFPECVPPPDLPPDYGEEYRDPDPFAEFISGLDERQKYDFLKHL